MKSVQIVTTSPKKEVAEYIGKTLVEKKLAACVQIVGPVSSIYRWKGQIEIDEEWQCRIKTVIGRKDQVEQIIKKIHPYDVPEIIVTEIIDGSEEYMDWLRENSQE